MNNKYILRVVFMDSTTLIVECDRYEKFDNTLNISNAKKLALDLSSSKYIRSKYVGDFVVNWDRVFYLGTIVSQEDLIIDDIFYDSND